jgi:predicted ABC-type ATPase
MKRLLILILIASTAISSCKTIQCKYNARKALKHQKKAAEHIEKLITRGCSFEIDSILKARTIEKVTDIDTVYKDVYIDVPSDNLVFEQTVRCDSLGNVILDYQRRLLRKPKFVKGEVKIVDNVITVDCKVDSLNNAIKYKDRLIISQNKTIENLRRKTVSLKELPKESFWSKAEGFLIWLAVIIVLAIIARITYYKLKL